MHPFKRFVIKAVLGLLTTGGVASASSGYQCEAEASYLEFLETRANQALKNSDFSCFESLASVNVDDRMVVDVRSDSQFRKFRIPQSIHLSPSALLNMPALRSKHLLVVNKGFQRSELAKLCNESRQRGFADLSVLNEGVAGWAAAGHDLEGDPRHISEVNLVTAEEFLAEWQRGDISVLAAKNLSPFFLENTSLGASVSWLNTENNLESQLIKHLQDNDSSLAGKTVVISDRRVSAGLPELRNVFLLEATAQDLFRAKDKLQLIANSRDSVPNRFRCRG